MPLRWPCSDPLVVLIPALFILTVFTAFLLAIGESLYMQIPTPGPYGSYIKYSAITGFFLQDEDSTVPGSFDYTKVNLGLINRTYETDKEFDPDQKKTQWERFQFYVTRLNERSPNNVQYKVLYMGRHGEGFHNVAESFYGTAAWDCYWSLLDGNDTSTWADAHLTENGINQAKTANRFWANALRNSGIPAPETYYCSPLARCLETARVTYSSLELPSKQPFIPIVKELLRESIGVHTCDRRSSRTWIHEHYPSFKIEPGFAEEDPLWTADLRESGSAEIARLKKLLDNVFTSDDSTFISFTSHSGAIGATLSALGHRPFGLVTGSIIPVLVQAETIQGPAPSTGIEPSIGAPTCTDNPTPLP